MIPPFDHKPRRAKPEWPLWLAAIVLALLIFLPALDQWIQSISTP